jgi:hypothetical protein
MGPRSGSAATTSMAATDACRTRRRRACGGRLERAVVCPRAAGPRAGNRSGELAVGHAGGDESCKPGGDHGELGPSRGQRRHLPRAAAAVVQRVQASVGRDLVQPGAQRGGVDIVRCGTELFATNHPNPGSDSQPKSGRRNIRRNISPDIATFTRTGHHLSRPVEGCVQCRALAGVRNLDLDDPGRDRPDSHCNFGDRRIRRVERRQHVAQVPYLRRSCPRGRASLRR